MSEKMTMTTSPMEKIFGKGALEVERKIPGTRPSEDNSARYISFDDPDSIPELFNSVVRQIEPPLMKGGGVVLEGARLKLPDGTQFFAVLFHGDIEGWQRQIEYGASELGRATARVLAGDVLVSDGRSYPLSSCEVEFH
jgi:hypothetical protein